MSLDRRKFIKLSTSGLLGLSAFNLGYLRDEIESQEFSMAESTFNNLESGYS